MKKSKPRDVRIYARIYFTIAFIIVLQSATAQDNKLLFHYNRHKEAIYSIGDVISFRIKGSKEKTTWQITGISDSTIISMDQSIAPHKISFIYLDKKSIIWFAFKYKWTRLFLFAGVGYFLIDWANSGEIDRQNVIVSGSLLTAALISKLIIKKHIRLKGSRKLVILR